MYYKQTSKRIQEKKLERNEIIYTRIILERNGTKTVI